MKKIVVLLIGIAIGMAMSKVIDYGKPYSKDMIVFEMEELVQEAAKHGDYEIAGLLSITQGIILSDDIEEYVGKLLKDMRKRHESKHPSSL